MIEIVRAALGTPDFEACMAIRMDVFVQEQNVPAAEERDALDITAVHVLALIEGQAVGTARAVEKNPGVWKIGRVAVRPQYRGLGVGQALMRGIEAACPASHFTLSAQTHALNFYEKIGYRAEGPIFLEAGILHRIMNKATSAP